MIRYRGWWLVAGAAALAGCGGSDGGGTGPGPGPGPEPTLLVVSNALAGSSDTNTVWVSLPPGTVPAGVGATVTTDLAQGTATATMLDGGFDPVALPALDRDTVTVMVQGPSGVLATYVVPVPMRAPPIVVRTYPPKSKKDVPLNLRALVVFSEPMRPSSLTTQTVRLLLNGQPVAGYLTISSEGTRVEFRPFAPLAGTTDYVLEVTTGVTDLSGDPLAAPILVTFTTETPSLAPVAKVTLDPDSAFMRVGGRWTLSWQLTDTAGNPVYRPLTWATSDPAVVTVNSGGSPTMIATGPGQARITLTSEGVSDTAWIRVVAPPSAWRTVEAGLHHSCAVADDDLTYCWGHDYLGILGTPPDTTCQFWYVSEPPACLTIPSPVTTSERFTSLAAGERTTCGLTPAGEVYCWGRFKHAGLDTAVTRPVRMAPGRTFTRLMGGGGLFCGLDATGQAWCWGRNDYGQLGDGTLTDRTDPVPVAGGHQFSSLGSSFQHTCGVDLAGAAWCWGRNDHGELGIGSASPPVPTPTAVSGTLRFGAIEPGRAHTCGLLTDGTAYCWGDGSLGALGVPGVPLSTVPIPVQTTLRFSAIGSGSDWSCALEVAGQTAWCWGVQHDYWTFPFVAHTPQPALDWGGTAFLQLSLGMEHACGLTASGSIHCWGDDVAAQSRPFRKP